MDLNIQGQSVTRVCFDAALTILTSEDCELRVESEATLGMRDGALIPFAPESPGTAAADLVELRSDVIVSAEVGSAGELAVTFESGRKLVVSSHGEYEAWGFVGCRGRRVTCMPGGELAVWGEGD
ncbi:DUF6188 family protein [Streptomyces roseifaciens]|uniref:DUF6188 family protein n=1 Tax=Streptomyces roseifaciens TaxID=1488406 RepID=UPI003B82C668